MGSPEVEYINSLTLTAEIWSLKELSDDKIFMVVRQRLKRVGSKCWNFYGCLLRGENVRYAREELIKGDQLLIKGRIGNWKMFDGKYKVTVIRASEIKLLEREDKIAQPWKFNDED